MPVNDKDRTRAIFENAVEIASETERRKFVLDVCRDDSKLLHRIETLLECHDHAEGFLGSTRTADEFEELVGTDIDNYKLLKIIGEGGMGIVYVAEQRSPIRRLVALKIVKPGKDSKQAIARFEAERQTLALMSHPNITHVFDAGATPSGRPYFVMELVRGFAITEFCDKYKLTLADRIRLFVSVCRALQHAHQKGIILRDIKPSNILVTMHDGVAVPKLIDFGVAKALNHELSQKSTYTLYDEVIGTPMYMSPEQTELSGLDLDTRTDIYSLAVLLYELLTGSTPIGKRRLSQAAFYEVLRIIRDEDPTRPSLKLSTQRGGATVVATGRSIGVTSRINELKGELEWIVMKGLEKDRARRYASVGEFAADIERYLNNQPVEACPPSTLYRLRKFASRNVLVLLWSYSAIATMVLIVFGFIIFFSN